MGHPRGAPCTPKVLNPKLLQDTPGEGTAQMQICDARIWCSVFSYHSYQESEGLGV